MLNKARRGEVYSHAPIGYVKSPNGELALDADEQVQGVVRLIFEQFERQGTVCAVLRCLVRHRIFIPVRRFQKQFRGQLQWHRPSRTTVQNMLHHPIYAGYYRFGHRSVDPRKKVPGKRQSGRMFRAAKDCPVLLPDRCPAYISKEQYQANQTRLNDNRARAECLGAPRQGPALLSGLLVCGRCGYRMVVNYAKWGLRYNCYHALVNLAAGPSAEPVGPTSRCPGRRPGASSITACGVGTAFGRGGGCGALGDRCCTRTGSRRSLEHLPRYDAERAARQYGEVEPENRLVARELERWEEALHEEVRLKQEYEQFCAERPAKLSAAQREQIRQLAQDIPKIWLAETTTAADRQRLIRMLVERVKVEVQGQSEQVKVAITWSGGSTDHQLVRTVGSYVQLMDYSPSLCSKSRNSVNRASR